MAKLIFEKVSLFYNLRSATRHIHVISREIIKPSPPTPTHINRYNLSGMDEIMASIYMPIVLFYPSCGTNLKKAAEKSLQLKSSLSQTLNLYYPFAGRLSRGPYINCNDEGVEFHEAKHECRLPEILSKLENGYVNKLFPPGLAWASVSHDSSLIVIRLNYFECGGMAMTMCMSHKLADACTLGNFLIHWAAVTRGLGEQVSPHFISFPRKESMTFSEFPTSEKNWVTKKFVFHNSVIANLKDQVTKSGVQDPTTRVSVVTALLYKCAIAATKENSGSFQPSALTHMVNARPKMIPPLPETSVGNLYWNITLETRKESESKLNLLVNQINKGVMQIRDLKNLDANKYWKAYEDIQSKKYKVYLSSSLCGFPFYKVDFGWGKPIRVSTGTTSLNNMFVLLDTPRGDGIEALVSLTEQDMAAFKVYEELQALSSIV
ncbi:hypothetical protein LguiB_001968 [Lonicera macranthoides]